MPIVTMEEEIVGVSVRPWDSDFQNIVMHSFEFPEAWADWIIVCWLNVAVACIGEGKILFLARNHVIFWMCSNNR